MASDPSTEPPPDADAVRQIEALRTAARQLDEVAGARAQAAAVTRERWVGPGRERFDVERARRDAQLAWLVEQCRALAARAEAARAAAPGGGEGR